MTNILKEMLLIDDPSVFRLYKEMMEIARYFIAPVFTIALILEYFGSWNFGEVVKKLLIISLFMGVFYEFHTKAVEISLSSASETLMKVSPRNLFVKKWYQTKIETRENKGWGWVSSFAVPNLNDLVATTFFVLAKLFIWFLKLIYSTVFHLTYVFSGVTAILYFLGWTKDALKGTVQAMLWTILMPFVMVAILALVGNSIDDTAVGGGLIVAKMDTILWLFGITLLLLLSPLITYSMIRGDGISAFGSTVGSMLVKTGTKGAMLLPMMARSSSKKGGFTFQRDGNNQRHTANQKSSYQKEFQDSKDKRSNSHYQKDQGRETSKNTKSEKAITKESAVKSSTTTNTTRSGPSFTKIKESQSQKRDSKRILNDSSLTKQTQKHHLSRSDHQKIDKNQSKEIRHEKSKDQVKERRTTRAKEARA